MTYFERAALVSELIDRLQSNRSWAGSTHIQKTAYFLQALLGVPLGYDFSLYKHGPYSFDLADEVTVMRADGLLDLKPNPFPFGPSYIADDVSKTLRAKLEDLVDQYADQIEFVATTIGKKGVAGLERISTALYVTEEMPEASPEDRAERVHDLKPHISLFSALRAVTELDQVKDAAQELAVN